MPYRSGALVAVLSANTNAAPNTITTTVAIAAPGVGQAIRIVAAHAIGRQNNTGRIRLLANVGGFPEYINLGVASNGGADDLTIPEPGRQLPINTAFAVDSTSDVATQGYTLSLLYYLDSIT